eukprot:gene27333-30897_t
MTDSDKLVAAVKAKVSLRMCGANLDCARILAALFKAENEFMVRDMDYIVISRMGIELLVVQMKGTGEDRSIFIDLTVFRSSLLSMQNYASLFLTGCAVYISSNGNVREVLKNVFSM